MAILQHPNLVSSQDVGSQPGPDCGRGGGADTVAGGAGDDAVRRPQAGALLS